MGEVWRDHHDKKDTPTLREAGGIGKIELRKEMEMVKKMALQSALAIDTYLRAMKRSADEVDFVHPWANGQLDRKDVMRHWMTPYDGKSNADRLGEFLESDAVNTETVEIDLTDALSRKLAIERMHLHIHLSDAGPTLH